MLGGQFIIAMPGLTDENFSHSVACITEHTEEGTLGLVINKVHSFLQCSDIFKDVGVAYTDRAGMNPVYVGGPVHENKIFILHSAPFEWEGCYRFSSDIAISNTMDILKAIASESGPEKFIVMLGCAGWGKNQLESEIINNLWLTSQLDMDVLFNTDPEHRWRVAIEKLGFNPALLSIASGKA